MSSSASSDTSPDADALLLAKCRNQVQELHALFVTWFQGKQDKLLLTSDLQDRLSLDFSHVAPNGQLIRGRNVLLEHLQDKYSVYSNRVFDISIYNVRVLWSDDKHCLCTYEEWQRWNSQEGGEEEDVQFGRLSTCLLQMVPGSSKMQWIHVHETWLEAETPPSKEEMAAEESTSADIEATDAVTTRDDGAAENGSKNIVAPEATATSNGSSSNHRLLYFMSSATLNQGQLQHQNMAQSRLKALKIDYETVDAGDIKQRDFRNQLFEISGQRAMYPLFFLRNYGNIVYWGNWEQFLKAVYSDKLLKSIELGTPAKALGLEDDKDDDESEVEGPVPPPKEIAPVETAPVVAKSTPVPQAAPSPAPAPAVQEAPKPAPAPVAAVAKTVPTPMPPITHQPGESAVLSQSYVNRMSGSSDMFAREISSKRHVSPLIQQYAKPLTWENALVGVSVAGFDIGTSQGPIADEAWYKLHGAELEDMAQSRSIPRPRRKICLPEMVFPTAHVAMEGHGVWFSWDCSDALEAWARAHHEIAIHSRISHNGVSVMRARDAKLWDAKRKHGVADDKVSSVFHYDWTYSTPFTGKHEGGKWKDLEESGMNVSLLTDTSVPILFFDEIILFEDDLHDNGQVQYSVKLRVMPTCSYVLARLWVRVDNIILRVRETRILFAFGDGSKKPEIYRDVAWRECMWNSLADQKLPTDVKAWRHEGPETPAWSGLLKSLPEVSLPRGMPKYAVYEYSADDSMKVSL
jgi:hypothetical protein